MERQTTLGQVRDQVELLASTCHDAMVDRRDIEFDSLDTIRIAGRAYGLRPVAIRAIATRLGVPWSYLERCPVHLQAMNLNHWLKYERNDQLFVRFDGDEVRAVFTPRYVPVDNIALLDRLVDLGYGTDTEVVVHLDAEFMSLSIPDGSKAFSIKGDRFTPGLSIANSEVGLSSVTVSAYFLRLVCTNGMVAKTGVESRYRHVSATILDRLPDRIRELESRIEATSGQIRLTKESPVENPQATMEAINRRFQLSALERQAVEWGWRHEEGATMFHVIQAYTRGAQHPALPAAEKHHLEQVGGCVLHSVQ